LSIFRINTSDFVHETIDEEVVIINLDKGDYYSLVNTGTAIWNAIDQGLPVDNIIEIIFEQYEGNHSEIETSIKDFITQLQQEELIVSYEGEPSTKQISQIVREKKTFVKPMLK
jgi:Coenzyme PQQ synthesis protein D (PqqD)